MAESRSIDEAFVVDRRAVVGNFMGGFFALSLDAFAQQPAKVPRIGVLGNNPAPLWDGLRRGLSELGYVDGRNVVLEWRWGEGKADRYPALAIEFVQSNVDLIVTSSTQATLAAKQATSSIPIVMLNSVYPDKIGLVEASPARAAISRASATCLRNSSARGYRSSRNWCRRPPGWP